jgi:molybdopterin-containing oxidoreductase family iron-sulfur binding subunit
MSAGMTRRACLGAAIAVAPGLFLVAEAAPRPPGAPASPRNRWGMLIDVSRCKAGCTACVVACRQEQGWGGAAGDGPWIRKIEATETATGRTVSLPVMCQQCGEPPCVEVCPTGASLQRADGVVLVDRHRCIGCRYCVMACPFGVRFFVDAEVHDQRAHTPRGKGTAEGCTLCVHRLDAGRLPACVEACSGAGGAMLFGNVGDPESEIAQALRARASTALRAELGLAPAIRYQGI